MDRALPTRPMYDANAQVPIKCGSGKESFWEIQEKLRESLRIHLHII